MHPQIIHPQMKEPSYCIVTGANAGIGKEVTAGLMAEGAHVVMACRNMQQCEVARADLEARQLSGSCECSKLDLADQQLIRDFAVQQGAQLKLRHQSLDVLVNNAGVMGPTSTTTTCTTASSSSRTQPANPQAAEPVPDQHLLVNHLGPFLLTGLLLPHMTAGSRIVNVSSRAHFACKGLHINGSRLSSGSDWWLTQYACSKLCNILHTRELQDRYQLSRGIITTSVSPGFVNTTIFRSLPSHLGWVARQCAPWLGRTPAKGAEVAVFAATSSTFSADKSVPLLLHDCKPLQPSALAQDKQLAVDLWEASCAAVGWKDDSQPQQK